MKLSNTVVSVIIIVAILVSAYALGLLIRQARTGRSRAQTPAEATGAAQPTGVALHGPGEGRTKDTPEERAKIKEQKAQAIEKMNAMTPEQKQKFREQIRKQVGGRQPAKGPKDVAPAPQGKKTDGQNQSGGDSQREGAGTPASPDDGTTTKPSAEKAGVESGQAGPH